MNDRDDTINKLTVLLKFTDKRIIELSHILGNRKQLQHITRLVGFPKDSGLSDKDLAINNEVFAFHEVKELLHHLQEIRKILYLIGVCREEKEEVRTQESDIRLQS